MTDVCIRKEIAVPGKHQKPKPETGKNNYDTIWRGISQKVIVQNLASKLNYRKNMLIYFTTCDIVF